MSHTSETSSDMTDLIQRFVTLRVPVYMTQEELEKQLHEMVWKNDWQEVLNLLGLVRETVSPGAANECAVLAVQYAPVEVVSALLELLPGAEYTACDTYEVDWSPTGELCRRLKWEVSVQGTLVMHAVAQNRPDVLELLLERGCDVNCASAAAAAALLQNHCEHISGYGRDYIPFHAHMARPENWVKLRKWDAEPDDLTPVEWEGATPLALAVLLGHGECARVLIEQGAWLEEAPSVSAAMYLFWREKDPDYQAARTIVLAAADHARHRPVLWAAAETCSSRQLKGVLDTWDYDRRELTAAAHRMVVSLWRQGDLWKHDTDSWNDLCSRMSCIGHSCPEAVRDRTVIGELLNPVLEWKHASIQSLLPILEGATLDVSELWRSICCLERPGGQKLFTELAERCHLVMDRDVIAPYVPLGVLRTLLKNVTFLPPVADQGVSGLTQALLRTGDLRLIRNALKSGLIPLEESTVELLHCQQALGLPPTCRSALLTSPRPKKREEREQPRAADMRYRWFSYDGPRKRKSVPETADWAKQFWFVLRNGFGEQTVKAAGTQWQLHKTFFAACMKGQPSIVEQWLRYLPAEELRNVESAYCAEKDALVVMSPLCAAALGGQTQVVELLLRHGALQREEISGSPSVYTIGWTDKNKGVHLPLNPVLAAALGEHWDTVRCLLGHGAVCDWAGEENQLIWSQFHPENLQETAARCLEGGAEHDVSQ